MTKRRINDKIKTFDVNEIFGASVNERTDESLTWFFVAKDNLSTAKLLFENKKYHHCVFFLQQSIECIIKGILIENKIVVNAQDFSHSPVEALEQFYIQVGAGNTEYCQYIRREMEDKVGFEERITHMAYIYNYFMRQYFAALEKEAPEDFSIDTNCYSAIGLPKQCDRNIAYWYVLRCHYTNIFIFCIAILFSNTKQGKIQQNTRYPMEENGKLMPQDKYPETEKIVNGLSTIIPSFDSILKTILRES